MDALSVAYGHIRVATRTLLDTPDPTGDALNWGLLGLDIEAAFDGLGVSPAVDVPEAAPTVALAAASDVLETIRGSVPLGVVAMVTDLRRQVS